FARRIWPNVERALDWIAARLDAGGFLRYARSVDKGLLHQAWKDSDDSVFHADGSDAPPPLALCEVRGYAYAACRQGARLAEVVGEADAARRWRERAEALHQRFEERFWLPGQGFYALALDGNDRPCAVRSSNPGHVLYTGIAAPDRAARTARALVSPAAFNGWGVRTVFEGEPRYNPMSYHNGSVWRHGTASAAAGMARYGFRDEALKLVEGLFSAAVLFDMHRLPELFCGFERLPGQSPTHYPVACSPQAWASGAVFMLLEAFLGLHFDPAAPRVYLHHPRLPEYLDWLRIRGLAHKGCQLDLVVRRHGQDIAANIERRQGPIELNVTVGRKVLRPTGARRKDDPGGTPEPPLWRFHGGGRCELPDRPRRGGRPARPQRRRQDDHHEDDHGLPRAHRGPDPGRRAGDRTRHRRDPGAHRLPAGELPGLAGDDGGRLPRLPGGAARGAGARAARRDRHRDPPHRARGQGAEHDPDALARLSPARGRRAGDPAFAGDRHPGRTHQRARSDPDPPDARADPRPGEVGHRDRLDPHPAGGPGGVRAGADPARRPPGRGLAHRCPEPGRRAAGDRRRRRPLDARAGRRRDGRRAARGDGGP